MSRLRRSSSEAAADEIPPTRRQLSADGHQRFHSKPIGILHVVDALHLGGMERMAVEMASLLDPAEFRVHLCATRLGGPMADDVGDHVDLTVLGRTSRWDLRGIDRFRRLVHDRNIDIVHSHGRGTARLVALCRATHAVSARHVFHDHFSIDASDRVDPGLRLAVRLAVDCYIGVSQAHYEWAIRKLGVDPAKVHLVRNGVDTRRFPAADRPVTPDDKSSIKLAMVAGLRPVKNHLAMLDAIARSPHRRRFRLVVAGSASTREAGYLARVRNEIEHLGLREQVHLVGSTTDVPALLRMSDVGVLSSRWESGPLALLEYMATGLPYVVPDTGELAQAVKGSGTGFVVPLDDPAALQEALDTIATMTTDARRAMGARGRALVLERFDQRCSVALVAQIYRSLMAQRADQLC